MKNTFISIILFLFAGGWKAQAPEYVFQELRFGPSSPDLEYSGLYIFREKLFLLPENKNKKNEGLYALDISSLISQTPNTKTSPKAQLYKFRNLSILINKINARGQGYDGLEGFVMTEKDVFFSVETLADTCYLIKGTFNKMAIELDPSFLIALVKPKLQSGHRTCNAGFEGIEFSGSELYCFFEFNDLYNATVLALNTTDWKITKKPLAKLPFRTTDVTWTTSDRLAGINYFYSGGGCDSIYEPEKNSADYHLVRSDDKFKNLARIIEFENTNAGLNWTIIFEFPEPFHLFNWEGIASYKNNFFLINDRYTGGKQGSHLYLLKAKE